MVNRTRVRRIGRGLYYSKHDIIIIIDICHIYFDTLMLRVSHAVEVLELCLLVV